MKAIVYTEYGPPDVLKLEEVEKPVPNDNEILVRVQAASVNFGDLIARKFKEITPRNFDMPFIFWLIGKMYFGCRKPKIKILGSEFAGEIESTGKNVRLFKEGDKVFGYSGPAMGSYAEHMLIPESGCVTVKPDNITFEEAAAIPYGAMMALNLYKKVKIQSGQKILVNGASGGIGPAVVQIGKYYGAEVTGVCGTRRIEFVKSLGADKVIDYTKEDFTGNGETYDFIFDILGKTPFSKSKKSLKQNGQCILVSFKMKQIFQMLWTSMMGDKKLICALSNEKPEDLIFIKGLIETGKIKPIIDKCFPLEQAAEAHRYAESGQKTGNVVITI